MADNKTDIELTEKRLRQLAEEMASMSLATLMHAPGRAQFCYEFEDLQVDCTRQPVTEEVMACLFAYARQRCLQQRIDEMMSGQPVNLSENRPVVHCNLRRPEYRLSDAFQKPAAFAEKLRSLPAVRAVVNLGIGGSDLGPAMVVRALAAFHDGPDVHFVANVDPADLSDVLDSCSPDTTQFIVTSKTFTTAETLQNAMLARGWLSQHGIAPQTAMAAVTANAERAADWGIARDRIFTFPEGVGGRYSLWSAVGLPIITAIGAEGFGALLDGAFAMDTHVSQAPFERNLAVIMGLLRVWHRSFLDRPSYGLMPYDQRLADFPAWAQQLEMESNGKGVDRHGRVLGCPAGPLVWGAPGTNSQHSFFQWLHQGLDTVPLDILIALRPAAISPDSPFYASHEILAINAVAQAEALALGQENRHEPHRHFPGNRPSVLLSWQQTDAYSLGRLLALYEHITTISGFIWDVNSFDQWGVELGKELARALQNSGQNSGENSGQNSMFSPAARAFVRRLRG